MMLMYASNYLAGRKIQWYNSSLQQTPFNVVTPQ